MLSPPADLELDALVAALADGWDFDVVAAEYAPVGAGSHHWIVDGGDGTRAFATVDDLDAKTWLGDTRDEAFAGLRDAFGAAVALRDAGLEFVVAPLGEPARRIDDRYTVALFPFVEGRRGTWGDADPAEAARVVSLLAELHGASVPVRAAGLELPGRDRIESALTAKDTAWTGGPLAEPAREAIAANADNVAALLTRADRLAAAVDGGWVVTHGEPHAGDVMRAGARRLLVDWDTVALAPPERDLWLVLDDADGELAAAYADAAGRRVDPTALEFFRRLWDLKDLAEWLNVLRAPHSENDDIVRQLAGLREVVAAP